MNKWRYTRLLLLMHVCKYYIILSIVEMTKKKNLNTVPTQNLDDLFVKIKFYSKNNI